MFVAAHRQTHLKVKTEDTLSGFQDFFLQSIIKDWANTFYTFSSSDNLPDFSSDSEKEQNINSVVDGEL